MSKRPVTIKTIAKEFNVTPATVSKALRDSSDISQTTKDKIKQLAQELGYKPNLMARHLVSKRSNIIGVIVPDISTSFFGLTVRGINTKARDHSLETIILINEEHPEIERKNIEFLSNLQVEGIILDSVPGDRNIDLLEDLISKGMPLVFIDRRNDKIAADSVTTNDVQAGYAITKYFIENGKRNIVFVKNVDDLLVARERFEGYQMALEEYGIKFNKDLVVSTNVEINFEELMNAVRKLVHSGQKFDGFICTGGYIAYYTGLVLVEEGFKIPGDILLGEFGDNNIVHRLGVPFVTIDQSPVKIGEKALELLTDQIESRGKKKRNTEHVFIKSKLIHHFPAAHKHILIEEI